MTPNKSKSKQLTNAVWGLFVAIYRCSQAVTALQSAIRGATPQWFTWCDKQYTAHMAAMKLAADSVAWSFFPVPQQLFICLQFALLSCKLFMLEMWRGRHCAPLQQSKSCSRLLRGYVLRSTKTQRAVWLLTRRDTAGKIWGLHIISSSLLEWTEPHRSWDPFPVSWDYFL